MVLENLIEAINGLNENLEKLLEQQVNLRPVSDEVKSESGNKNVDAHDHARGPDTEPEQTNVERSKRRQWVQDIESGEKQVFEKGDPLPPRETYKIITKAQYLEDESAPEPNQTIKDVPVEEVQEELPLEDQAKPMTQDILREGLRAFRSAVVHGHIEQDMDKEDAAEQGNAALFGLLRKYSDEGTLPGVSPEDYQPLYDEADKLADKAMGISV